jgi:hydrogenase expression/formation protein HypC
MIDACGADHCVTCSDEARPMQVLTVEPSALARCIDEGGATCEVMIDLVGEVVAGDTVLVHAGVAIATTESAERFR